MTLDLDALARLVAAMTPGPYHIDDAPRLGGAINARIGDRSRQVALVTGDAPQHEDRSINVVERVRANAAGIVALVNAAPELLRMARGMPGTDLFCARQALIDESMKRQAAESGLGELVDSIDWVTVRIHKREAVVLRAALIRACDEFEHAGHPLSTENQQRIREWRALAAGTR